MKMAYGRSLCQKSFLKPIEPDLTQQLTTPQSALHPLALLPTKPGLGLIAKYSQIFFTKRLTSNFLIIFMDLVFFNKVSKKQAANLRNGKSNGQVWVTIGRQKIKKFKINYYFFSRQTVPIFCSALEGAQYCFVVGLF